MWYIIGFTTSEHDFLDVLIFKIRLISRYVSFVSKVFRKSMLQWSYLDFRYLKSCMTNVFN